MSSNAGIRLLASLMRYLALRRQLDAIQPVPGSRERRWELSTWLMALGGFAGIITFPLGIAALTFTSLAVFVVGLLWAIFASLRADE